MADLIHVACAHCQALNRLPPDRLQEGGKCGRCKKPLFAGQPIAAGQHNWQRLIQEQDIPVVVDFWAPWCGPCRTMAPVFEQAAAQLEPAYRFVKLNTEDEPQLAAQYGIRSIPTLAVFHRGREIARQAGAMDLSNLKRWLQSVR